MRSLHALFGDPIGPILSDIDAFLEAHPKEVVILDFQHVFEFKCNDHEALVDKLFKTFGDKLCPIREDVSQLSIEQMAHTNKRVIVIYPSMAKVHNVSDTHSTPIYHECQTHLTKVFALLRNQTGRLKISHNL